MCRMVRDNLQRTVTQNQKQNHAAETQSQSQPAEDIRPETQEPTERQLDLLHWHKLNLEEEPEPWNQVSI